jgi:hypothetical protein
MSTKFSKWLTDNDQTFTVKYMFDHLRNIGLCALVLGAAVFLIKNGSSIASLVFVPPSVAGWSLMAIGFILVIINSSQFAMVAASAVAKKGTDLFSDACDIEPAS